MTSEELIATLKKYDKHLWGVNATYKEAAMLVGFNSASHAKRFVNLALEKGDIAWYKSPDCQDGPKSATKGKSLSRKQWDKIKSFFSQYRELIESEGATVPFVVRLMRRQWLVANEHIVNEMLRLKKITLKGVC